ncbi:PKD domain-containing protein [Flavobacterium sp. WC2509]|uniref:PKD domain-containing protein n=1 Tax=Flavobacterium sp. WC2509 TaxID=3461406 RepID=UPI004044859D
MANYYIDIIDQELSQSLFVIEVASREGITLSWNGSDKKDELKIVGSSLAFDIAHTELKDAKFIRYFTGNEIRFKTELRQYSDNALLWTGFLVPDTYSEPYTNSVTFVEMTATCGLGRLKGKYLPESYYRDEKSIIDILCKSLSLTGLQLDLFFNPAIENSVEKSYKNIFIDTASFVDKSKKQDVYKILETLMNDMLCVCYQADGRWNIEGINQRSIRGYNAKLYDYQGNDLGVLSGNKLYKKIKALVTPNVTMIPPYNMITVTHERVPQGFPETIAKEKNEGWAVITGVKGEIYATDWNGNNGYYAKAMVPDYYVSLMKYYTPQFIPPTTTPFDANDFVNLKNKIFVYKYQKIKISISFKTLTWLEGYTPSVPASNSNPFLYEIILNNTVLFSNNKTTIPENENIIFVDGQAKLDFEFIVPTQGLIDIKIYRSGQDVYLSNIKGFEIRELEISPVAFEENLIFTDLINGEYTVDADIELTYADDDTAFSNGFRLAKLKEATTTYNTIQIPVINGFTQNGNYYSRVALDGANLIKDNINTTIYGGGVLTNLEVIYNYKSSGDMVVKTDFPITSGSFSVKVYKNNDYVGSRDSWMQWTDAIYKIETNRYVKTVANIIRRMFSEPMEKLDLVAKNAVKFNDLIAFHYVDDKMFTITNCSWNLDTNKTTLTLSRAIYRDSDGGGGGTSPDNIPPIVNAGLDIELTNSQTSASLLAVAYDVDGVIVSQVWTKVVGGFGDVIMTPLQLATDLQNLTEDLYEYKIQVTDNDGATAFDTVRLVRRKTHVVSLELTVVREAPFLYYKYKFKIDPNIDPSFNLVLNGKVGLISPTSQPATIRIMKNGVLYHEYNLMYLANYEETSFSVGYMSTDEIIFEVEQQYEADWLALGSSRFQITSVNFITGAGDISGLPLTGQPVPGAFPPW